MPAPTSPQPAATARRSRPREIIVIHDGDDDGGDRVPQADPRTPNGGDGTARGKSVPLDATEAAIAHGRQGDAGPRARCQRGAGEGLNSSCSDEEMLGSSKELGGGSSGSVSGKGVGGSEEERKGAGFVSAEPVNRAGAGVALRTRSRASKQRRVEFYDNCGAKISDNTEEREEEEEEDVRLGHTSSDGAIRVFKGEKKEDLNYDSEGYSEKGDENEEEEEEEDGDCDSKENYELEEEEESDESEEEEEEDEEEEEAEEGLCCEPSNAMAGSKVRVGESTDIFRKRMFEGICLPEEVVNTDPIDVGKRTRSHFSSCLDKKRRLKRCKRGTFSRPLCIDVSESGSESEEEPIPLPAQESELPSSTEEHEDDDSSSDCIAQCRKRRTKKTRQGRVSNAHNSYNSKEDRPCRWKVKKGSSSLRSRNGASYPQSAKKGCKARPNPRIVKNAGFNARDPKKKRKCGLMPKEQALYEILMNTICDNMDNHSDDFVPAQSGNRLPLVFSFSDDDAVEKSEHGMLVEELWTDFDFATESMNIGAHQCKEDPMSNEQDTPTDEAVCCNEGKHHFILDEQLGIKCKYCSFVQLEIRYVMPSLGKLFRGRESLKNPDMDSIYEDMLAANELEGAYGIGGHRTGLVWDLIPGVREDMFAHQREGFEFTWRNLAGSVVIEELKRTMNTDVQGGCVISHAPGTGKTRLAIVFVQSYLEIFPWCRPVIIAPKGMLATWEREFRKWKVKLPFQVLNSSELHWNEDKTIQERVPKDEKLTKKSMRMVKLVSWHEGTSILGVSYTLFKKLATSKRADEQIVRRLLLDRPGLLVLDEGHTPRNERSLIWKVLAEVRTEKRIILSGTPFQNNFLELYNILCLVRPKFARKIASKTVSQQRKVSHSESQHDIFQEKDEGKDFWRIWTDLTSHITNDKIEEVRSILKPFVHVHDGDILQSLPGLRESVVILNPLPRQKEIITRMENIVSMGTLDAEYKISLASVHPSLITCTKLSEREASVVDTTLLEGLRSDPYEGVKTKFVLGIVRLCRVLNERVIVFSQYLEPLSLIKDHLVHEFSWSEGKEVLQMSGKVQVPHRQALMEAFNDMKSEAKVMLASTKACCEGITLIGASRVVLLDVVWNPAVGRQAIGRAYRIGQEKIVCTYNLIAAGTKEKEKHDRQAKKDHMSKLLFSRHGSCNVFQGEQVQPPKLISDDKILEEMTGHDELKDMFVNIFRLH